MYFYITILLYFLVGVIAYISLLKEYKMVDKKQKIVTFFLIIVSLIIRSCFLKVKSNDYIGCLEKWVYELAQKGGFSGIKYDISDYTPAYMYILAILSYLKVEPLYLIKVVSVMFDFVLAYGSFKLVQKLTDSNKKAYLAYFVVLFLPTVVINGACWAQCDSIYVSFIVWSLYYMFDNKQKKSLIALAIAFSFKLQTVFIMPVYLVFLFSKRIKIKDIIYFPITYFVVLLPALLLGKPLLDMVGVYKVQVMEAYERKLSMNCFTIFNLLRMPSNLEVKGKMATIFICVTFIILFIYYILLFIKRNKFFSDKSNNLLQLVMLLISISIPFFLPYMHDRYFYIADILSVVTAIIVPQLWYIAILVVLGSFNSYMRYFGTIFWIPNGFFSLGLIFVQIRLIRVIAYNLINNTENLIVPKIKESYFFKEILRI